MLRLEDFINFVKNDRQSEGSESVIVDGILFDNVLENDNSFKALLLLEKKECFKNIPGTGYYYRIDHPRGIPSKGNLKHIHIYVSPKKELFAMNIDGSAHDGYHKVKIPIEIAIFLRLLNFNVPDNNIIEWMDFPQNVQKQMLCD